MKEPKHDPNNPESVGELASIPVELEGYPEYYVTAYHTNHHSVEWRVTKDGYFPDYAAASFDAVIEWATKRIEQDRLNKENKVPGNKYMLERSFKMHDSATGETIRVIGLLDDDSSIEIQRIGSRGEVISILLPRKMIPLIIDCLEKFAIKELKEAPKEHHEGLKED